METLYGILSDFHRTNPTTINLAMQKLVQAGAQKLILNGDLTGEQNAHHIPAPYYLDYVLKAAADTNLETYVQFGSHEEFFSSEEVIKKKSSLYGNIINISTQQNIIQADHNLLFLPGSDVNSHGEYTLGTALPSGIYLITEDGPVQITNQNQYTRCVQLIQEKKAKSIVHYENTNDLTKHAKDPQKTILICHIPPLSIGFNAIDRAQFGLATEPFMLDKRPVEKDSIFPYPIAKDLISYGAPIAMQDKNVGNLELAQVMHTLGITKSICGHIHEASHRAHDLTGTHLPEHTYSQTLLYNASCMDKNRVGLLYVKDNQVAYKNILI